MTTDWVNKQLKRLKMSTKTKCIDLTREVKSQPPPNPIIFIRSLNIEYDYSICACACPVPNSWGNIELVQRLNNGVDVMFAYDDNHRNVGVFYLGHWNDGFTN